MVFCVTTKASNLVNDYSKEENTALVNGFNLFCKSKWLLSKASAVYRSITVSKCTHWAYFPTEKFKYIWEIPNQMWEIQSQFSKEETSTSMIPASE